MNNTACGATTKYSELYKWTPRYLLCSIYWNYYYYYHGYIYYCRRWTCTRITIIMTTKPFNINQYHSMCHRGDDEKCNRRCEKVLNIYIYIRLYGLSQRYHFVHNMCAHWGKPCHYHNMAIYYYIFGVHMRVCVARFEPIKIKRQQKRNFSERGKRNIAI